MAGLAFPDVGIFISACDPNDPNSGDLLWSPNLAPTRTWRINQADRGRQYEQDQNLEGSASIDWRNADEALNPANASSPLLTYARPMRRIRMLASYPPAGTGNLVNTTAGMDPTVDSYTTGTLPSWLAAVGGTSPTVQAANPRSGANSVQYTVAGTTTPQGLTTAALSLFPGKQYTASWYVRQSSASTQQISVGGLTSLDRFQRTGNLSGSAAETGQTWSTAGGVSGDYTTTAGANPPAFGVMSISNSSVNVARHAVLNLGAQDFDERILVKIPAVATGATIQVALEGRYVDANNHYRFELDFTTSSTVDVVVKKVVSGVVTTLATTTAALAYAAGSQVWIRAQASGTTLQAKAWIAGTGEPSAFTTTITDASFTAAGLLAVFNQLATGNTNGTVVITHARFAVTSYSAVGTTTTTTGAYVRLSVTFTATQPSHTIAVNTIGTAVAGTVNLDDIQVEPGGTANTFTQTGPLIRGLWGGHVMDFPATWVQGTQGFEGSVSAPCSGPFAALSQIPMHTDYITAVLRKAPDYYWPLWEPSGVTTFAEISGHGGPPMQEFIDSAIGNPGNTLTTFSAGASTNIPGDPGGVGLQTFNSNEINPGDNKWAQAGATSGNPSVNVPGTGNSSGYSVAFWLAHTANQTNTGVAIETQEFPLSGSPGTFFSLFSVVSIPGTPAQLQFYTNYPGAQMGDGSQVAITDNWADGKMHLYVMSVSVSGGNGNLKVWIDGVQVINDTQVWLAPTPSLPVMTAQNMQVGASSFNTSAQNAVYAHVALFNRTLSAAEAADLWNAGNGNQGETAGSRVARYLGNYYTGPSIVDGSTLSRMGPPTAPESTPLLQALQRVQDTEMGNLFESRDGAVQFDGREVRWQRLTPTATFGDGPGEIPYEEAPVYGYGLTQANNQALVTRSGGVRAVAVADTTGAINSFYPRGYTLTVDCQTDSEAQQHANWVVLTRAQPKQRVTRIRINLGANPSAFPALMNLEIGSRVTQNRRPKAANAGAGITMSGDFFIEKVTHSQIDPAAGTWFVDLEMSPVPTPQPWIVGDATYGVVGVTTRPGW